MVRVDGKKFLNIREIADRNGISGSTVRRLIKAGKLPAQRTYRGEFVVLIEEVEKYFRLRPLLGGINAS